MTPFLKLCSYALLTTLAACATTKLPESTSSMAEMYDGVDRSAARPLALSTDRPLAGGGADLSNYTRSAATELTRRFPRVPNPTLVMFVFPHIVGVICRYRAMSRPSRSGTTHPMRYPAKPRKPARRSRRELLFEL
jgi:conjugative transfer region lipoprotein (TIGR03751 family)